MSAREPSSPFIKFMTHMQHIRHCDVGTLELNALSYDDREHALLIIADAISIIEEVRRELGEAIGHARAAR